MDLKSFLRLKEQIEQKQREVDRGQGQLEQISKQLKTELDCSDLKEVSKKLSKLKDELTEELEELEQEKREYEKEFGALLGE